MEDTKYQPMNFELHSIEIEQNKKLCIREGDYYT